MAIGLGDVLRVAVNWSIDGANQVTNVHTFLVSDLGATTDDVEVMEDIAAGALADWYAIILPAVANNVVGTTLTGQNLTEGEVLPTVTHSLDGGAGSNDILPFQTSGLAYWGANEPRRQARTYLPPFDLSATTDTGAWDPVLLADIVSFAGAALGLLSGPEVALIKLIGAALAPAPLIPTYAGVSVAPRTQRRRTPGRGS